VFAQRPGTPGPDPLPAPPAECHDLDIRSGPPSAIQLHHVGKRPLLNVRPGGDPLWRFDCPAALTSMHPAHYGVWYGGLTPLVALCEYFVGKTTVVTRRMRAETTIGVVEGSLRLLDLRERAPLRIYASRLDNRIGNTGNYSLCQEWSAVFHKCASPDLDGLIYTGRRGGNSCVAVFERAVNRVAEIGKQVALDDASFDALWREFEDETGIPVPQT
jgi:hypothetical protein